MVINFFEDNRQFFREYLKGALIQQFHAAFACKERVKSSPWGLPQIISDAAQEVAVDLLDTFSNLPLMERETTAVEDSYFVGLAPKDLFEYIDKLYARYNELGGDEDEIEQENIPALMRVILILANLFENELRDYDNAYETLMNGFDIDPGNRDILKRLVVLAGKMEVGETLVDTFESVSELVQNTRVKSELLYAAGRVYLEVLGDPQCAKIVLHISLEHNPQNRRSQALLELVSI